MIEHQCYDSRVKTLEYRGYSNGKLFAIFLRRFTNETSMRRGRNNILKRGDRETPLDSRLIIITSTLLHLAIRNYSFFSLLLPFFLSSRRIRVKSSRNQRVHPRSKFSPVEEEHLHSLSSSLDDSSMQEGEGGILGTNTARLVAEKRRGEERRKKKKGETRAGSGRRSGHERTSGRNTIHRGGVWP